MEAEFIALKQGKKTVDEYYEAFERLGKYAPSMISTERDKRRRFMQGININYLCICFC